MLNWFQRLLYRLAMIAPIIIISVVLRYIQARVISVMSLVFMVIAVLVIIYHVLFFHYVTKSLPSIDFVPDSTPQEDDKTVIEIAASYLFPFIGWCVNFVPGFNLPVYIIPTLACVSLLVCLIFINHTVPSPFYWVFGYHFHTVESGGKTYRIVSRKRNYRNTNNIKKIKRIFDDLLLVV